VKKTVLLISILLCVVSVNSQTIWELTESRINGKTEKIDAEKFNIPIDISSMIFIGFHRDSIREKLSTQVSGNNLGPIIQKINDLQKISEDGLRLLPEFSKKLSEIDYANTNDTILQKTLTDIFNSISLKALDIIDMAEKDEALRKIINNSLEDWIKARKDLSVQYEYVFKAVNNYAHTMSDSIDKMLVEEGIYLQMGATLYGKNGLITPIHIDGFDNIKPPEFYDPYDFKLALTDEQKKELNKLQEKSKEINEKGVQEVLSETGAGLKKQVLESVYNTLNECKSKIEEEINKISGENNIGESPLKQKLKELQSTLVNAKSDIELFYSKYVKEASASSDVAEFQDAFFTDVNTLIYDVQTIIEQSKELRNLANESQQQTPGTFKNAVIQLSQSLQTYGITKLENINKTLQTIKFELTGYRTIQQINSLVVQYTDEILKLNLDNIPDQAVLNIRLNAGFRQQGDNIVLQMIAGKKSKEVITLQTTYFTLLKTRGYMSMTVGLAFTKNARDSQSDFVASPASNVLFRFPYKGKSTFYREYIDFGLGLSIITISSSDSSVFSLGAGPVFTAFRDMIQMGAGYDFFNDNPYWMIGFKIPFLTHDFGGTAVSDPNN